MEYTHLGRSGLSVSRLILGTMKFGPETSEVDSDTIMDRAHEHGINFFDTANVYGARPGGGVTEQIIGRWFAAAGARELCWPPSSTSRQATGPTSRSFPRCTSGVRATPRSSGCRPTTSTCTRCSNSTGTRRGRRSGRRSTSFASRERCSTSARPTSPAGTSRRRRRPRSRHFLGLVSEQSIYNLMTRWAELEVLPAARRYGLGVIPWSPLHGGVLGGVLHKQKEGGASRGSSGRSAGVLAEHRQTIEAYEKLCTDLGEDPAHVGLAWLLAQDGVTGPIIGPRTAEQLDGSLRALQITLDDGTLAKLDQLFPPPAPNGAKPAPEAYAWQSRPGAEHQHVGDHVRVVADVSTPRRFHATTPSRTHRPQRTGLAT